MSVYVFECAARLVCSTPNLLHSESCTSASLAAAPARSGRHQAGTEAPRSRARDGNIAMASHATPSTVSAVHDNCAIHSAADARVHAATRYSSSLLERQWTLREAMPREALR